MVNTGFIPPCNLTEGQGLHASGSDASEGLSGNVVIDKLSRQDFLSRSRITQGPVNKDYDLEANHVVGVGTSGQVRQLTNKITGQQCAVKVLRFRDHLEMVPYYRREVNNYLKIDHPHIARLLHVYEESEQISLVMELCTGRELFERLVEKKSFSETEAQQTAYQMLLAVSHLHRHGLLHLDIKLENFVYLTQDDTSLLKLIDFGTSVSWKHRIVADQNVIGTVGYMAPEVFQKRYTDKADTWSLGVATFLLLTGTHPFPMDPAQCRRKVLSCTFIISEDHWANHSVDALDFVLALLEVQPDKRMSSEQALEHPWVCSLSKVRRVRFNKTVVENIQNFANMTPLQRSLHALIAYRLSATDITEVQEQFMAISGSTGIISRTQFIQAMQAFDDDEMEAAGISTSSQPFRKTPSGSSIPSKSTQRSRSKQARATKQEEMLTESRQRELQSLFDALDVSSTGEITLSDFVAAMLPTEIEIKDEIVQDVFNMIDRNGDGAISTTDLKRRFGKKHFEQTDMSAYLSQDSPRNGKKTQTGSGEASWTVKDVAELVFSPEPSIDRKSRSESPRSTPPNGSSRIRLGSVSPRTSPRSSSVKERLRGIASSMPTWKKSG